MKNTEIGDLRAFADAMRPLPTQGVLDALGYMYDIVRDGFWTEKGLVTVNDKKISIENWTERQPRNSIDLVKALKNVDFEGAVGVLADACGMDGAVALAAAAARDIQPAPVDILHKNEPQWRYARDYLTELRKIPCGIVDKAHLAGAVWSDDDKNVVFGLGRKYNQGVELRGTRGGLVNGFRGTRGAKEPFFLQSLQANEKKVVAVVESAIEAMSLQAQHLGIFIMSTGGSNYKIPLDYIEPMKKQGYKIITAFNADGAGDKHRTAFKSVADADMKPQGKDWNLDLRSGINTPLPNLNAVVAAATINPPFFLADAPCNEGAGGC